MLVTTSSKVQVDLEETTTSVTAAYLINTPGKYHNFDFDGTGCDIALYIASKNVSVYNSEIHDGTRAGIVADTTRDTILFRDAVDNIGDHTGGMYAPDGVQYGIGVLVESGKDVTIHSVSVSQYQKDGFKVLNSTGTASYNTATGAGMINYIAQNGFEFFGSDLKTIDHNRGELNQYAPTPEASGYLICGTKVKGKLLEPSSRERFADDWENLSMFNDIPYFFSKHPDCS